MNASECLRVVFGESTGEEDPVSGATHKIWNTATGNYLDSQGEGALSLGSATTYDDQEWILTQQAGGAWTIQNARSGKSYLDTETNNVVIWNDGYIGPDSHWLQEETAENFRPNKDRSDRSYLYGISSGEVCWNTGATDAGTVWTFERQ